MKKVCKKHKYTKKKKTTNKKVLNIIFFWKSEKKKKKKPDVCFLCDLFDPFSSITESIYHRNPRRCYLFGDDINFVVVGGVAAGGVAA